MKLLYFIFLFSIFSSQAQTYCASYEQYTQTERNILDVKLFKNSTLLLQNASSCSLDSIDAYHDYASLAYPKVVIGKPYTLSVGFGIGTCFNQISPNNCIAVYIDWNHNGVFEIPAERLISSPPMFSNIPPLLQYYTANFTVPLGAVADTTRMRIKLDLQFHGDSILPCGPFQLGETEDYSIVLSHCDTVVRQLTTTALPCYGDSTAVIRYVGVDSGTAPYLYAFDGRPYSTSDSLAAQKAGIHTAIIKDYYGCTYYDTLSIPQPAALSVAPKIDSTCYADSTGQILYRTSGGTLPYSFRFGAGSYSSLPIYTALKAGSYTVSIRDHNLCTLTHTDTLYPYSPIQIVPILDSIQCHGTTTRGLHILASGSKPPYLYGLNTSPYTTTKDYTSLDSGLYRLRVIDSKQCRSELYQRLDYPPQLTHRTTLYPLTCAGDSSGRIAVQASAGNGPPYRYLWSTGAVSDSVYHLAQGDYSATVYDRKGCTDTLMAHLSEPTPIVGYSSIIRGFSCYGDTIGTLQLQASGGSPPYFFKKKGGLFGVVDTFGNLTLQSYTFYIRDQKQCLDSLTYTPVAPQSISAQLMTDSVSCFGVANGSLTVSPSGGTLPYRFEINGQSPTYNNVFSSLSSGLYRIRVTDDKGCLLDTSTMLYSYPAIISTWKRTDNTCYGDLQGQLVQTSITGGMAPYRYALSGGGLQASPLFSPLPNGYYTLWIEDSKGCRIAKKDTITSPPELKAFYRIDTVSCYGGSNGVLHIHSQGGKGTHRYTYGRYRMVYDTVLPSLPASTDTLLVLDSLGCRYQVVLTIPQYPAIRWSAKAESVSCRGAIDGRILTTRSGGKPPYRFQKNHDPWQTSSSFYPLASGRYRIAIQDDKGCMDSTFITLDTPQKNILSIPPQYQLSAIDETVVLEPNYNDSVGALSYRWTPSDGLSCADCATPTFNGYLSQTYKLYTLSNSGCIDSATTKVWVPSSAKETIYVPNVFYPLSQHPENKTFRPFGRWIAQYRLKIFNRWGEKIFESNLLENAWDGTYKGERCEAGIYNYTLEATLLDHRKINQAGAVQIIW